jgi:outer membrane receptor protein involved in Fe transport
MKINRNKVSVAVRHAINAGLVFGLAAPIVHAQQTAATPPVQTLEKVEVTGSRISSATFESASPINTITANDIALTGLQSTANIINQLPQAFADQGGNISNGADGTSTVNLRGLGASRTLVLIDGKRVPAGSPTQYATNLNNIPAPLIKRVEVLTGGASAVYGSDAVAGVINFIMNDSFEGVQVQYNGSTYQHTQNGTYSTDLAARSVSNPAQFQVPGDFWGEGTIQNYNILMGANFANGKGNATLFFQYQNTGAVLQSKYNYSACSLGTNGAGDAFVCGGSSTASPGRFTNGDTGKSATIINAAGDVRKFSTALDQFNFGPYNYYQRPQEDYQANVFAHYDLFPGNNAWMPSVRVYAEFDFTSTTSVANIAPGGIFYGLQSPSPLRDSNPLLSQSFKDYFGITPGSPVENPLIGRRNTEGGPRTQSFDFNDYRYVLGAKGDFANHAWDYDFWWQSGKNSTQQITGGYFLKDRLARALNVVKDPTTGAPVCASVLDKSDTACIPYDIYHNGGVTQAQIDYMQVPALQQGYTQQNVVGLHLTSDLGASYGWTLPWAKNGVGVAVGYEHRTDRLSNTPDGNLSQGTTGNLSGVGGATKSIYGQVTVDEFFAEAKVPIAERQDYAYLLQFDGSYRYSDYSNGPHTNSYGLGMEWAPVKGYTLRGSYQQAIRAANIIELFTQQGNNLFGGSDPCAGPDPSATLAQCLRTGLAADRYGSTVLDSPAGQYNYLQGGNPNLTPEKADSYTVGLVLDQPSNIKGLSATIDYWNIKVKNKVGNVGPQDQLNQCITAGVFCENIHRDSLGTLWLDGGGYITATNLNLGTTSTSGIDLTANYAWPIKDWGTLLFSFTGTYIDTFVNQPLPGGPEYDCVGLYGLVCTTPTPRWRSNVRVMWNTPWYGIDAGFTWRYIDSVSVDATSGNPALTDNVTVESATKKLGSRNYLDLVASWQIDKNWSIRAGVNNVLDKDPPITSTTLSDPSIFGNGNTFPQVYDSLGRLFFLNVTAKF